VLFRSVTGEPLTGRDELAGDGRARRENEDVGLGDQPEEATSRVSSSQPPATP
jgi:hypothetical protein